MTPFLHCLLTGDTAFVGGDQVWEQIHAEYIGLRENKSTSYILDMIKEISHLETKVFIIEKTVEVLAHTYSRELVMELKQTGVKGSFNWSDKKTYSNDLRAAISYGKKYKVQAARKDKELKAYYTRHGGGALQMKDFEVWAVTLGKYFEYHIDYDVITVARFCHMMNQYDRYCEVEHAQANNILE